jgi:hypothetical protein
LDSLFYLEDVPSVFMVSNLLSKVFQKLKFGENLLLVFFSLKIPVHKSVIISILIFQFLGHLVGIREPN